MWEYISGYLREYAWEYRDKENDWEMKSITPSSGSKFEYAININLPMTLNAAADEIDRLRKKVKELEKIERIINLANQSE